MVSELLTESQFLVDVQVKSGNAVRVYIDNYKGLTIDECKKLSRRIESILDAENVEFELEVSSPGVGKPFKVIQQYHKSIGRPVEVVCKDGIKIAGILSEVSEAEIVVLPDKAKKAAKNAEEPQPQSIEFNNIKACTERIIF